MPPATLVLQSELWSLDRSESPLSRPAYSTLVASSVERETYTFTKDELDGLAVHCAEAEYAATKVERRVKKSDDALLLESRIGERFDSIVVGAFEKGTWGRLLNIAVEGKPVEGFDGLDVGGSGGS